LETPSLNILLVDDDTFFANIIASQLSDELKCKVTVTHSVREAQEQLKKTSMYFDMILTDYHMPEMTGIDLLKWLHDQRIETPVVMLTAAGSDVVAVEAMKLGAYDYVRKEQLDLQHLSVVIYATKERHQFRVTKELEEERLREIGLNKLATDKVRDVLNAITPTLNSALANINGDIEVEGEELCKQLPAPHQDKVRKLLQQIQREAATLETSIRGLLGLYRMLYAHHAEAQELDRLKKEIIDNSKPS
jgi:DNA-binding NtrC family response regulator